jgi:hypothetical protein
MSRSTVSQLSTSQEPRVRGFLEGIAATLVVILCILLWNATSIWRDPHKAGQDYRNSILLHEDPNYGYHHIPQTVIGELCWRKLYSMWGDPVDDDWMTYHSEVHPFMAGCANMSLKKASRVW